MSSQVRSPRRPRHERLTAWQAVRHLTRALFRLTIGWRGPAAFLGEQLRAGAVAATTAVAVGAASAEPRHFREHLRVATLALVRLEVLWDLVRDERAVPPETWGEIEAARDHAERLIRGLHAAVERKLERRRERVPARKG